MYVLTELFVYAMSDRFYENLEKKKKMNEKIVRTQFLKRWGDCNAPEIHRILFG